MLYGYYKVHEHSAYVQQAPGSKVPILVYKTLDMPPVQELVPIEVNPATLVVSCSDYEASAVAKITQMLLYPLSKAFSFLGRRRYRERDNCRLEGVRQVGEEADVSWIERLALRRLWILHLLMRV